MTSYIDIELEEELESNRIITEKYMELIRRLQLISTLEINDTLCITIEKKMKHKSIITGIWRTYYGDDRIKTIEWISNVISESIEHIETIKKYKVLYKRIKVDSRYSEMILDLSELIRRAIVGLTNLKITYEEDEMIKNKIDEIVSKHIH